MEDAPQFFLAILVLMLAGLRQQSPEPAAPPSVQGSDHFRFVGR